MRGENKPMEILKTPIGKFGFIIVLYIVIFGFEYALLSVFSDNLGVVSGIVIWLNFMFSTEFWQPAGRIFLSLIGE